VSAYVGSSKNLNSGNTFPRLEQRMPTATEDATAATVTAVCEQREFLIDNLLVRIHLFVERMSVDRILFTTVYEQENLY
jgi:hypothetical protein